MIRALNVDGYRSIRGLRLELSQVNLLTGPNGSGKSNLYNAMRLIHWAASGRFGMALAEEGGLESALWAGPRKKGERHRINLSVELEDFGFSLVCGRPAPPYPELFMHTDPQIKEEAVWLLPRKTPSSTLLERKVTSIFARDAEGQRSTYAHESLASESVLSQLAEPDRYPVLGAVRDELRAWRFYHQFRTDSGAPLRHPQIGVLTPVLSHDGHDLAAAIATIFAIGDGDGFARAVTRAFGGARVEVSQVDGRFSLVLNSPGLSRPLGARELSDGTLRFLCVAAALSSPRPPPLLALNEPETSIHPSLLGPLAELMARASERSQLWVTTHSAALADALTDATGRRPIELELVDGKTRFVGGRMQGRVAGGDDDD